MYNVFLLFIEIIVIVITFRLFKTSKKIVEYIPRYNDLVYMNRLSNKIRILVQGLFMIIMAILFVLSIVSLFREENFNFLFFIGFLLSAIFLSLLNQGCLGKGSLSYTEEDTFLNSKSKKALVASIYVLFFMGFISIAYFMSRSSIINSSVEDYDFKVAVQDEFDIDAETILFIQHDYLYLYSDFTSGLNIYDLDGNYIKSFYFFVSPNGASSLYIWNDSIFIKTRNNQLIKYTDGEYKGRVDVYGLEEADRYSVYDEFEQIIVSGLIIDYRYNPVAFDNEYLYLDSWDEGGMKHNGVISSSWVPQYDDVAQGDYISDGTYQLIGSQVYQNQEAIISTSNFYYVSMNFGLIWIIGFFVAMSSLVIIKLNNLNNMTIKLEVTKKV
ncbi:hypothetical protein RJI07_03645 [Mycoplasmatota bacterium WC30]